MDNLLKKYLLGTFVYYVIIYICGGDLVTKLNIKFIALNPITFEVLNYMHRHRRRRRMLCTLFDVIIIHNILRVI